MSASEMSPHQAREAFRAGLRAPTAGYSAGWTQANLISLPHEHAYDFLLFSQRNPCSCPVLDVTEPGGIASSLFDGDLRTDLPAYRVYQHGELVEERAEVRELWRDDLVSFLIGCSFTFEAALLGAGVPVRHIETGKNVPMYRTNRECRPAGRMAGPLVVSMRPLPRRPGRHRRADHFPLPDRARCSGAHRRTGADRGARPRGAGLRRGGGGSAR